jgi:hypothetical protein
MEADMVFPGKRSVSRTDHEHAFSAQQVGADLQRQICGDCGHISISPIPPASVRSEITVEKAGLFGGGPEFVYELAEALALIPATDRSRPRFGEGRTGRTR